MQEQEKDPHLESFEAHPTEVVVNGRRVRYYHHAQSPAAWTGVIIAMIGFTLTAVAAMMGPNYTLVYIGAGLVLAGGIVGLVMKKAGLGHG